MVCKIPYNERNKTPPHLWGAGDARKCPSQIYWQENQKTGEHRVVCAEWDLLSGLCLPAAPAELPATGPGSGTCFLRAATGDGQGESNEPRLEGKWDFCPLKVRLFQVTWPSWRLLCRQAQRAFHTWQTSSCFATDAQFLCMVGNPLVWLLIFLPGISCPSTNSVSVVYKASWLLMRTGDLHNTSC